MITRRRRIYQAASSCHPRLENIHLENRGAVLTAMNGAILRNKIIELLQARKPESSICPSDAPRAMFVKWRDYMPHVRRVAFEMAQAGVIVITQRGVPVDLEKFASGSVVGPIRLRLVKA
jgi:Protein of unknown function (DUF3253)